MNSTSHTAQKTAQTISDGYPTEPDIEVLICTHNRRQLLERTLNSLGETTIPKGCKVGVLVVVNACTDNTLEWLAQRLEHHRPGLPLRWMEDPVPGKSHALNFALPQSRGRFIAFVDDDHRVDSRYFSALWAGIKSFSDAELFCGRILPDWTGEEPVWAHDTGKYRIYPLPVPRFEQGEEPKKVAPGTATPGGGNLVIRRELFDMVGPFRLELGPQGHDLGGAEDIEWVRRAINGGHPLYYLPEMVQYHYVDPRRMTLRYVMRKAFERSASTARLNPAYLGPMGVPPFMLRKVLGYLGNATFSFHSDRRRFYLTRLAASLGEIKGAYQRHKQTHEDT